MARLVTPEVITEAVLVPLNDLKNLRELFPTLSEHATRETVDEKVWEYAFKDLSKFPPIKVVDTDVAVGVLDGSHRTAATKLQAELKHLNLYSPEVTPKEYSRAMEGLTTEQQKGLAFTLENTAIPAMFLQFESVEDMNAAALEANLENGLPPASTARVHMAVEYFLLTRSLIKAPTQAAVARKFGIKPPTLNEYLKKQEKAAEAEGEGEGEGAANTEAAEAEKFLKKTEKFIATLQALYEEDTETYNKAILKLFPVAFMGLHDMNAEADVTIYGDNIRAALQVSSDTDASQLFYVEKFHKGVSEWVKKSAASAVKKAVKKTAKKAAAVDTTEGDIA